MWNEPDTACDELVGLETSDVIAVERDSPASNIDEAKDCLEECRLTSAVRSDDSDEFALVGVKVRAVEDVHPGKVSGEEILCLDDGNF